MLKVLVGLLLFPPSQSCSRELSYPQRMYSAGLVSFENGDLSEGKNAWTKYWAFCRLSPQDCDPATRKKVEEYFSTLNAVRIEEVGETKVKLVPEAALPVSVKPVQIAKPKAPKAETLSRSLDPSQLVKQAERAREQGQLEQALRYYQMAEKINSGKEEFAGPIGELEKMME